MVFKLLAQILKMLYKSTYFLVYGGGHEPPKSGPQSNAVVQTPPSYRMPPVPPFVEAGIPGSTVAFSTSAQLYTHSSKFPVSFHIIDLDGL